MSRTARFPIALQSGLSPGARTLSAALVALCVALSASAALAGSDYPTGLFENSPVVGPGGQGAVNPAGANPSAPAAGAEPGPTGAAGSEPPYPADAAPPYAAAAGPPGPISPTDDYCDGIGMRTFASLEEVRRAHAVCDRRQRAPGY